MATQSQHSHPSRFALRPVLDHRSPYGAWWPASRSLNDQLETFFAVWPPDRGRVQRILYSPPDWDDHPRSVQIPGRRIKTGSFPGDDTQQLTLTMATGERRTITVIPPETPPEDANRVLDTMGAVQQDDQDDHLGWDNEGGHL